MRWILYVFVAPGAVLSYLLGGLSMLFWLAHKPRWEQAGVLSLEWREWFATGEDNEGFWRFSTTLVRTIWWQPGRRDATAELDEDIERHETVHLRQWEDYMMLSWVVGLATGIGYWASGDVLAGFGWWLGIWLSGALWHLPNFVTAMLRFGAKNVYRDSEHERSAYAQTTQAAYFRKGETWWEMRERARELQDGL